MARRDSPPSPPIWNARRAAWIWCAGASTTEWPRGETYGDLLRRIATREKNPVKVRLLIWYSYLGGQVEKHMAGYTDGMLVNMTSDEVLAQWSAMVGSGTAPRGAADKPRSWERADHCAKWWRWARDKANAHMIEVRMRDGDGQAIRASLAIGEGIRPGRAAGSLGGVISEKTLLEDQGTHHQKTVLIDYHHDEGSKPVGYVMGLNSLTDYWDTREHLFIDPRREYDARGKTETTEWVRKARGKVDDVRLAP